MNLSESAQTELMRIIQDWQSDEAEQKEDDSQVGYYKQELARLEFHCQSLMQENLSLRASLEEYDERTGRTEEMLSKLQIQNEQLQLDLSERSEQLRLREENFLDKYAQHN
jgi:chromosome segregation ATPase